MFFVSLGFGGIRPCIFAFGGDQFQLPQQEKNLLHFATKFTFATHVGSLISKFLMPELRHSVHCLGRDTCFPLAFGVPAVLMLSAIGAYIIIIYYKYRRRSQIINPLPILSTYGLHLFSVGVEWVNIIDVLNFNSMIL